MLSIDASGNRSVYPTIYLPYCNRFSSGCKEKFFKFPDFFQKKGQRAQDFPNKYPKPEENRFRKRPSEDHPEAVPQGDARQIPRTKVAPAYPEAAAQPAGCQHSGNQKLTGKPKPPKQWPCRLHSQPQRHPLCQTPKKA
jgi:hypothetical protein